MHEQFLTSCNVGWRLIDADGHVWIAALLSMLLGLDRMFRADAEDERVLRLAASLERASACTHGGGCNARTYDLSSPAR